MNDGHGSVLREMMKRSMEQPAGQWHPTNRREPKFPSFFWLVFGLALAVVFWLAFANTERHLEKWTVKIVRPGQPTEYRQQEAKR